MVTAFNGVFGAKRLLTMVLAHLANMRGGAKSLGELRKAVKLTRVAHFSKVHEFRRAGMPLFRSFDCAPNAANAFRINAAMESPCELAQGQVIMVALMKQPNLQILPIRQPF